MTRLCESTELVEIAKSPLKVAGNPSIDGSFLPVTVYYGLPDKLPTPWQVTKFGNQLGEQVYSQTLVLESGGFRGKGVAVSPSASDWECFANKLWSDA